MKNHDCICNFFSVVQLSELNKKFALKYQFPILHVYTHISINTITISIPHGEFSVCYQI